MLWKKVVIPVTRKNGNPGVASIKALQHQSW